MQEVGYILFGDIEAFIKGQFEHYQTKISFPNALKHLHQTGKSNKSIPRLPDFMTWDFANDDTFLELVRQIPVMETALSKIKKNIRFFIPYL